MIGHRLCVMIVIVAVGLTACAETAAPHLASSNAPTSKASPGTPTVGVTSTAQAQPITAKPGAQLTTGSTPAVDVNVTGVGFTAVAHRLQHTETPQNAITLSPPNLTDSPLLSAQDCYDKMVDIGDISRVEFRSRVVDVQLLRFTNTDTGAIQADGSVKPFWIDRLAWAFRYQEVRGYMGPPQQDGKPRNTPFVHNTRILIVADAMTGVGLGEYDY